jgi:Tfp pilus assembly protein PilO
MEIKLFNRRQPMAIDVKTEAKKLIEKLPNDSTWDDLMHEVYIRQAIESGLEDSKAGRTRHVSEIRKKYGLK